MMYSAILLAGLLALATVEPRTITLEESVAEALQNIAVMEADIYRFYDQWRELPILLAHQAAAKAITSCEEILETNCTQEKSEELKLCIYQEVTHIYNETINIYNRTIKNPWEQEFKRLKNILETPFDHAEQDVLRAIQTVDVNTKDEKSVRYRFYTDLINFQLPNVAPDLHPILETHSICLERSFPKV